ncbi:MAG TPA: hypothetical protein VM869_02755 [Enhygromyxa sp.]|nr:hypothetical protein [Enhygromyxa sp.]
MDAIARLLNAGDTVEAVHQAAWYVLLQESGLLSELGFQTSAERKVTWEPKAGLFDLEVAGDGQPVWIELKVDSDLSEWQLSRQLPYTASGTVLYALLGLTALRARPSMTNRIAAGGGHVRTGADIAAALDRTSVKADIAPGVAELARAYAAQLRELTDRGSAFRSADPWTPLNDVFLYELLRTNCSVMHDSTIAYVSNPSGGFQACHWGWFEADAGVCSYLQWEGQHQTPPKLCIKIHVTGSADRDTAKAAAARFLADRKLTSTTVKRPQTLRSGKTMTVGIIDGLDVRSESSWQAVLDTMVEATRLTRELAEHLRAR